MRLRYAVQCIDWNMDCSMHKNGTKMWTQYRSIHVIQVHDTYTQWNSIYDATNQGPQWPDITRVCKCPQFIMILYVKRGLDKTIRLIFAPVFLKLLYISLLGAALSCLVSPSLTGSWFASLGSHSVMLYVSINAKVISQCLSIQDSTGHCKLISTNAVKTPKKCAEVIYFSPHKTKHDQTRQCYASRCVS